jgi:hypothetical protein
MPVMSEFLIALILVNFGHRKNIRYPLGVKCDSLNIKAYSVSVLLVSGDVRDKIKE